MRRRICVSLVSAAFFSLLAPFGTAAAQSVVSIDEARAMAREHSWDRASVLSRVEQAEILLQSARAVLLPRVEAVGSYTFNGSQVEFDFPNPIEPLVPYLAEVRNQLNPALTDPNLFLAGAGEPTVVQFRHDVRGSLTVSQTLFNARAFPLRRQAFRTIELAEHGVDQVEQMLDEAVLNVYFGAVEAQRFITIAERNLELAQLNADRAQASFEEGVGNRFEANRARVDLSAAQRDVENARTTYQIAVESLATLLGRDSGFDVAQPAAIELPADLATATASATSRRADVRVYDLQLALDEERVQETRVQWLPVLSASATGSLQRKSAFGGDIFTWSAGVSAYWEIYDGGLRRAERNRRELDLVESEIRREQVVEQVSAEVTQLRRSIEQDQRNVTLATEQVELARANVEVTQYALEQGAASLLDVQYSQQQAYLSEIALLDAEINLLQRQWELGFALDLL